MEGEQEHLSPKGGELSLEDRLAYTIKAFRKYENKILASEAFTPESARDLSFYYVVYWSDYRLLSQRFMDTEGSGTYIGQILYDQRIAAEVALASAQQGNYRQLKEYLKARVSELRDLSICRLNYRRMQKLATKLELMSNIMPDDGPIFLHPPPAWEDPEIDVE